MSVLDILLIAIGAYLIVRGLMRGFAGEFFSLLGAIGSFYCSMAFNAPFSRFLSEKLNLNPLISATVAIVAIFLAVLFLCEIAGKQLKRLLKATNLSKADTVLGGVTGFLKFSVLVFTLLIIAVIVVPLTGNGWVRDSKVLTTAAQILPVVYPPLEERGLVPNLEELRRDAIEFISKQSLLAISAAIGSGDVPPAVKSDDKRAAASGDLAEKSGLDAEPGKKPKSAAESYRKTALEFFLGGEDDNLKKKGTGEEREHP